MSEGRQEFPGSCRIKPACSAHSRRGPGGPTSPTIDISRGREPRKSPARGRFPTVIGACGGFRTESVWISLERVLARVATDLKSTADGARESGRWTVGVSSPVYRGLGTSWIAFEANATCPVVAASYQNPVKNKIIILYKRNVIARLLHTVVESNFFNSKSSMPGTFWSRSLGFPTWTMQTNRV